MITQKDLQYKKIILTFIIFIISLVFTLPVFAETISPTVYAPSCILMDTSSGKILYSKNANEIMYPASTTKVMTAILALENCKLTDIATVSYSSIHSVPAGYTIANLQEGEELTIEQLLYILLIPSANDAAYVLAEHIGGSVDGFSEMMNNKAKELGCKNTNFVNPNGIHNDNHYSTSYDLALIGKYAMQFDEFRKIVSTLSYTLPITNKYDKEDRTFTTTNNLLRESSTYYYEYATGAKTGYTEPASNCIISTATKNNMDLIVVILHDTKTETGLNTREVDCKTLFEYGFNNYERKTLYSLNTTVKTINISNANIYTRKLNLQIDSDLIALVPSDYDSASTVENIILNDDIKAPISKGSILGTISITADGSTYTANLIASNDVVQYDSVKILLELTLVIVILLIIATILKHKTNKSKEIEKTSKFSLKSFLKKSTFQEKKNNSKERNIDYSSFDFYPKYK